MKFSLRFLFASRGKFALVCLGLSFLWLWLCWPSLASSPDGFGKGCGVVACLAIEGVILSAIYDGGQRHQRRRELQHSRETETYLYERVSQLTNFSLDYWCVLAAPEEVTRALAVDTNATQIAILDYWPSKGRREKGALVTTKILKRGDVASVALEETITPISQTMWDKLVEEPSEVQHASYLMRADGMLPHLEKDPPLREGNGVARSVNPPIPAPIQNQKRQKIKLSLKLTLCNAAASVEQLDFFVGEADSSDTRYRRARGRAQHWQALFEGLRSISS